MHDSEIAATPKVLPHPINPPASLRLASVKYSQMVGGQKVAMCCGHAYEIDHKRIHEVANRGTDDRMNSIFDYVPPDFLES